MLRLMPSESWPGSWKLGHHYDRLEIWGSRIDHGYCYLYQIGHDWALRTIQELLRAGGSTFDVAAASGNFPCCWPRRAIGHPKRSASPSDRKCKAEIRIWRGGVFAVLAGEVIEEVSHRDIFLVCLAKLVKPGASTCNHPNGKYFRHNKPRFSDCPDPSAFESVQFKPNSDGHFFLLDRDECRTLVTSAGLEVKFIALMTNLLTRGHVKLGHLLPYLPARLVWTLEAATTKVPKALQEKIKRQMVPCHRKSPAVATGIDHA